MIFDKALPIDTNEDLAGRIQFCFILRLYPCYVCNWQINAVSSCHEFCHGNSRCCTDTNTHKSASSNMAVHDIAFLEPNPMQKTKNVDNPFIYKGLRGSEKQKSSRKSTAIFGGELGIRTLGTFVHSISSAAPSTTRTTLHCPKILSKKRAVVKAFSVSFSVSAKKLAGAARRGGSRGQRQTFPAPGKELKIADFS